VTLRVVLDAAAFDHLDGPSARGLLAILERAVAQHDGEVRCAAVTLAEVCRGPARTRRVEAILAARRGGRPITVVPTDERLAKLVGAVLDHAREGSAMIADAHVVAVCAGAERALVVTSDPDDIVRLSAAVPATRVLTHTIT
jgi:predicted nucleic acid-binding protein